MYSHNKGNCFSTSQFTHPFYCSLCKQKSEIPFRSPLEWKVLYCCYQASLHVTSKMLRTFFLKYKLQVNGTVKKKSLKKKPKHTFFRLHLFFSFKVHIVCTLRLYRQCHLQATRTFSFVQQTDLGRFAAAGKAAPLPDL